VDIKNKVFYSEMESTIGPLLIATTDQGICWIGFGNGNKLLYNLERWTKRWLNHEHLERNDQTLHRVMDQFSQYFEGKRNSFDLPVDLYGTPFQIRVWQSLLNIPYGQTRSYKDIALEIGIPKAVRAIGGANNRNPVPIIVPCHRVIGTNGALVGYGGGLEVKETLLNIERI
jgi:methylated-DNA-[protein]-cysteine S-methyltransferase